VTSRNPSTKEARIMMAVELGLDGRVPLISSSLKLYWQKWVIASNSSEQMNSSQQ